MWTVDGDGLMNYGRGYALADTVDSNDLCDIAEAHNAEVAELKQRIAELEPTARPGMRIQISVTCQNCEEYYLNTPALTVARAAECAESLGWFCDVRYGWLCPTCSEEDK